MALLHQALLAGVIAITSETGTGGPQVQGSGFITARPDNLPYREWNEETDGKESNWHFYVVTCRHVIEGIMQKSKTSAILHFNHMGEQKTLPVNTQPAEWYMDDLEDIAVLRITNILMNPLLHRKIPIWGNERREQLLREEMKNKNVEAGHPVFLMGYPEGRGLDHAAGHVPLVRGGMISQIDPYLRGNENTFLVDGNSYGGNSGGPVYTQPIVISVGNTHAHAATSLIGMMCGSSQSQRQEGWWDGQKVHRLRETSGLGIVVGMEPIQRAIDKAIITIRRNETVEARSRAAQGGSGETE